MIDWLDCGLAVLVGVLGSIWWHWNADISKYGE